MVKIKSAKHIGKHQTYDLEIDHPDHQFYLANGLLTSNSHAICYSYTSYACSWLYYYYPVEWITAVLENEMDKKPENKQAAMSLAKNVGFTVILPDIKASTDEWRIVDDKTIAAPLNLIKGMGEKAIKALMSAGPFDTLEQLLDNPKLDYRAVNKKIQGSLCLSGALDSLMDERFEHRAHLYASIKDLERKNIKKLNAAIDEERGKHTDFTNTQKFLDQSRLLGYLDLDLMMSRDMQEKFRRKNIPSISEFDLDEHQFTWFYIQDVEQMTSKKGNKYQLVKCIGDDFAEHDIFVFGADDEIPSNICAYAEISKSIGARRWNVYSGAIRLIKVQ